MKDNRRTGGSRTTEKISSLWARLLLLLIPLTVVFLAITIPVSLRNCRTVMKQRQEEIVSVHWTLAEGIQNRADTVGATVLREDHMTDTARRAVENEMIRTILRGLKEKTVIVTEDGEPLFGSEDLPVPQLPKGKGTESRLMFLTGDGSLQKRRNDETSSVWLAAATTLSLPTRQCWLVTGGDVREAYDRAATVGRTCRLIYGLLLAAVALGGIIGTVLVLVKELRKRGISRGKSAGRDKISVAVRLKFAGMIILVLLLGLLVPTVTVSAAKGSYRGTETWESGSVPQAAELLAGVPTGQSLIEKLKTHTYTDEDFGITTYRSAVDRDGDGIDDQTDILESALAYVAKRPAYVSEYYMTGYPTENKGVCTDVIAFGFRGAGYDLMTMVWEDVLMNPAYYPNSEDENIDFRRVENDLSYFSRNAAESLTIDLYDTEAWQAGDIVVFEKHIGLVSNVRNYKGVPWLLHHGSEEQKEYVEDRLEANSDLIVAHFRWR